MVLYSVHLIVLPQVDSWTLPIRNFYKTHSTFCGVGAILISARLHYITRSWLENVELWGYSHWTPYSIPYSTAYGDSPDSSQSHLARNNYHTLWYIHSLSATFLNLDMISLINLVSWTYVAYGFLHNVKIGQIRGSYHTALRAPVLYVSNT